MSEKIIGIDLGTSNSTAAVVMGAAIQAGIIAGDVTGEYFKEILE